LLFEGHVRDKKTLNGTGSTDPRGDEPEHDGRGTPDPPDRVRINPELTVTERRRGIRPGDAYVRRAEPHSRLFRRVGPGRFVATEETSLPVTSVGRLYRRVKAFLIGRPLESAAEIHERLSKFKALAVFSSDAISSVAYATGEIMFVLAVAGAAALELSVPISLAVATLLGIVAYSYRQTVLAYPKGGGSYIVSRENIGTGPGLVAAAALLIDYILTVAVSISAGTHALTSAFPQLIPWTVHIAVFFVALMTLANLRGLRESGSIFAVPTYTFIALLGGVLALGITGVLTGFLHTPSVPPDLPVRQNLDLFLVLTAFSAGAVAMSGIEAISDGVPAFKPPESKNAATTLTVMALILATFFVGVSLLATWFRVNPDLEESVISQVGRAVYGESIIYYVFQLATMGILVVAANTAFADFPRLASILARDNFLPHTFSFRGDRLAFSAGIGALGAIAGALIVAFGGDTHALVPLYAVGVFLAFTLSQAGMVMRWLRLKTAGWQRNVVINGVGATLTAVILAVAAVTKFTHGAWVVMLLIPVLVGGFLVVYRHYARVADQLRIDPGLLPPATIKQFVIVPIESVNYASLRALAFARSMGSQTIALHISVENERAERLKEKMRQFAPDIELVILESPYRQFVRPMMAYIEALHNQSPEAFVTIVLPEFIPARWWEKYLHGRTAARLRAAFETHPNVAVVLVPYLLED
jgi:amino acid transporter